MMVGSDALLFVPLPSGTDALTVTLLSCGDAAFAATVTVTVIGG